MRTMMPSQVGFLPARFSEVRIWCAGDRSAKTFNGSNVSEWGDLSRFINNLPQPSATNQPLYALDGPNGLATMRFDDVNDYFHLPTPSVLGMQNADYEIFIVASTSDPGTHFMLAGSPNENFEFHINGSSGARFIPVAGKYCDSGVTGEYADGNPHLFGARVVSDVGIVRVDGVDSVDTETPARNNNNNALRLGTRGGGTGPMDGDISALVVCQPPLSTTKRDQMESFLNNKYGI